MVKSVCRFTPTIHIPALTPFCEIAIWFPRFSVNTENSAINKHWKLHLYQLLNRIHQLPAMNNTPVLVNCKAEKRRKKSCESSQLSFSDNY